MASPSASDRCLAEVVDEGGTRIVCLVVRGVLMGFMIAIGILKYTNSHR